VYDLEAEPQRPFVDRLATVPAVRSCRLGALDLHEAPQPMMRAAELGRGPELGAPLRRQSFPHAAIHRLCSGITSGSRSAGDRWRCARRMLASRLRTSRLLARVTRFAEGCRQQRIRLPPRAAL